MSPLVLRILQGPPGCGKSRLTRQEMNKTPARYIQALPTIKLLKQQKKDFADDYPNLVVLTVHSRTSGGKAVQKQLDARAVEIDEKQHNHVVVLITHDALTTADLSAFCGWHFYIDEAPNAVRAGKLTVSGSTKFFAGQFDLIEPANGWSQVRLAEGAEPSKKSNRHDSLLKHIAPLHRAASRSAPLISIEKWQPGTHRWFAYWSPLDLPSPASVTIAGASYSRSLGARLTEAFHKDRVTIQVQEVSRPRTRQPCVRIRYFAQWEAPSGHWAKWEGLADLKAIAQAVRAERGDLGFWSGNETAQLVLSHYISRSKPIPPKVAGLNEFDQMTSCAILYSSKATPEDAALVEALGLTDSQIREAREDEDIFQFVYRGAIRRPEYGGAYDIYLFSEVQAERLRQMLLSSGLDDVSVVRECIVGAPFSPPVAKPKGRKKKRPGETEPESRARKAAERRQKRRGSESPVDRASVVSTTLSGEAS